MERSKRQIISLCLLAVYAFYFASVSFFYHVHYQDDTRIVHSHPWNGKAHDHSSEQILLLQQLDTTVYESSALEVFDFTLISADQSLAVPCLAQAALDSFIHVISLRAPPVFS